MAMMTLKSISTAMELIEEKKNNLRKAFEELQAHASLLSSSSAFTNLRWDDIDSHFTSLHSDVVQKFSLLQSQDSHPQPKQKFVETKKPKLGSRRPDMKSLCEKMDGLGLRKFLIDRQNQRGTIRAQLADAWKHAPDPGELVLNAMQGFAGDLLPGSGSGGVSDSGEVRTVCLILLEEFMKARIDIGVEVKKKARALALEWKKKIAVAFPSSSNAAPCDDNEEGMEKLGFLRYLAAFDLVDNGEFSLNALSEYAVGISRYRQAVELCRVLGFGERISEVVNKLISKGERLVAVKFIFHFELTEKVPPLPLLEAYISEFEEFTQKVDKKGKNSRQAVNEAAGKEIISLKSVIKFIKDHNLESKYPKDALLNCVKNLGRLIKSGGKRAATGPALKAQQPSKKQKKSVPKHGWRNGAAGPSAIHERVTVNATNPPVPQNYVHATGLLTDPPYVPYAFAGSTHGASTYEGSSTGIYGSSGTPTGFSGNIDPSMPSLYPSESHVRHGVYDRPLLYSEHSLPSEYHPAYHPW